MKKEKETKPMKKQTQLSEEELEKHEERVRMAENLKLELLGHIYFGIR